MECDVRVVESGLEPAHHESPGEVRHGRWTEAIVHQLVALRARRCVAARADRLEQRRVAVEDRDLDRRAAPRANALFRAIEEPEVSLERRIRRDEHHVAAVVHDGPGQLATVTPLADDERAMAEPAQQPLQSTGMFERMGVVRRAATRDDR